MTPKEKAEELVDKMYNTEHCGIKHQPNQRYCDCEMMNIYQAKQCALVAVDEIIKSNAMLPPNLNWMEVKQEIEKL
jgi:hypothetical protein